MMENPFDNQSHYLVVINHEEQYSIWPEHKPIPAGWNYVGVQGAKDACLKYIETEWTDMRPRSLRDQMTAEGSTMTDQTSAT